MARTIFNISIVVLTVAYPLVVYFGLKHLPLSAFALMLGLLFGARLLLAPAAALPNTDSRSMVLVSVVVVLFAATVWISGSERLLLFYPVVVNACFLAIFAFSLAFPPPVIERLARITEPDLPPQAVRYTRIVTIVWCGFFIFNGAIAWYTALSNDLALWTLYNGLISYALIGLLLGIEYLVRIRFRRMHVQ